MAFCLDIMLVELGKDIAEDAIKGNAIALQVLRYLLMAHRNGKHLVFFGHSVASMLTSSDLPDEIIRGCYSIAKHTTSLGSLVGSISVKLVISQNTYTPAPSQRVILLNPYKNGAFEIYEETHLLTENLLDAEFYLALVAYYKRKARLKSKEVNFFPLQGGGDTISVMMEKEMKLRQHLCLAISDSDIKYQGGPKGGTYKNIVEVMRKGSADFCGLYCMEHVREVENLIPYQFIRSNSNYKNRKLIKEDFDFDMSYYDMKDGIGVKSLSDTSFVAYWRTTLAVHHKEFSKLIKKEVLATGKKRKRKTTSSDKILEGFGSKLMDTVFTKSQNELMRVDDELLTPAQQTEWYNIGKQVFDWCCAGKRSN